MTQAAEWQGPVGSIWASEYVRTDRSFAELSIHLDRTILDAAPAGSSNALDIGCGAGSTSLAIARARPNISVTGLDIAAELIDVAKGRARDCLNAKFAVADLNGASTDLPPLDLLFSRHGVMFFDDPEAVFGRLHAGAVSGASLVFSCFRAASLNPWAGHLAAAITGSPPASPTGYAPSPFAFADAGFVTSLLRRAGWRNGTVEAVNYRYVAGEGDDPITDALSFFERIGPVASALKTLPATDRARGLERVIPLLEQGRDGNRVVFPAAAWIWRATA